MIRIPILAAAAVALLAACDGPAPSTGPETTLRLVAVGDTNVETHWKLRNNTRTLDVRVEDGEGRPRPGVEVRFALTGPGELLATHAVTGAEGVATASFRPANQAASVVLEATAPGVPGSARYRIGVVPHWLEITPSAAALTPEGGCGVYLLGLVESMAESSGWLTVDFRAEDPSVVRIAVPNQSGSYAGIRVVASAAPAPAPPA